MDTRGRKQDSFGINRKGLAAKGWTTHKKKLSSWHPHPWFLQLGSRSSMSGISDTTYHPNHFFCTRCWNGCLWPDFDTGSNQDLESGDYPQNKPGAGGVLGTGIVAYSKPDGYTLLATSTSTLTIIPHMEQVTYDPVKDVIPIFQFGIVNTALVVRSDSPHKSFKDLIDFARRNPGKVSCGFVRVGTPPHLDIELLKIEENVDISIIPFGGAVPTMTALLGGHITTAGVGASAWMSHLKAGKVRVLGACKWKFELYEMCLRYTS